MNGRKWYDKSATATKYLMGGIGTGSVSLGSRGQLCDWEILNAPNVGYTPPYTFCALRTREAGAEPKLRVLEAALEPPYEASHGIYSWHSGGVRRLAGARLSGGTCGARVEFSDEGMPVRVALDAFSPFIPLNAADSSIPAFLLRYTVQNASDVPVEASVCFNLCNLAGYAGKELFGSNLVEGNPTNVDVASGDLTGVFMTTDLPEDHLKFGSMALCAPVGGPRVTQKRAWLSGNWWDGAHDFWDDFSQDGALYAQGTDDALGSKLQSNNGCILIGSVCQDQTLAPGEECVFSFVVAWHFPNRMSRWDGHILPPEAEKGAARTRNEYATRFDDAWAASRYLWGDLARLEGQSRAFEEALYASDISQAMLDAVAANLAVLRSTTCFRLENGDFFGWEGTFDHRGCCEGNCTHVWNYQQALAFLFPELERSMRRTEFLVETDAQGDMAFRASAALGNARFDLYPPAADGQMGCVVRLYRDWKLSGDDALVRETWGAVKRVMHYAMTRWDTDGDFVLDGMQHNTYDVEFYGVGPLTNVIFLAALRAAAEMAEWMGEKALADAYRGGAERGAKALDGMLFNGKYYVQKLENAQGYKYQVGEGCLSDQLLGQVLAHVAGLGYLLPPAHVERAMRSIYENNFRARLGEHLNVQRAYALEDEGGLLMCTWPDGGRPRFPFPYCDEIWTGVEYQVATGLIYEGMVDEAEVIVRAARDRHDGVRRNPWNEVECGNHYARSMSSWGLLLAMSGFRFDMTKNQVEFSPVKPNFQCFFSTGKSWGIYRQRVDAEGTLQRTLEVLWGDETVQLKA